jgi:CheY-like chemotaxis protein
MSTILLADDDVEMRRMLRRQLERLGADILEAADGQTALDLARTEHPTVAVLDLAMPALDGYEVCTRLKAEESTRDIPVFILTGHSANEVQGHAFCTGADGFFAKPWDLRALREVIAKFVAS